MGPACACIVANLIEEGRDILTRKGYQMATHFKFLIVKAPDVVRKMGLEAARGIGPRGVSPGAILSVECIGQSIRFGLVQC